MRVVLEAGKEVEKAEKSSKSTAEKSSNSDVAAFLDREIFKAGERAPAKEEKKSEVVKGSKPLPHSFD